MRKIALFAFLFVLAAALPAAAGHGEGHGTAADTGWFDLENCAFCKNLIKDPQLMDHMTWEHHTISNGAVTITTVDPTYRASYQEAMAAMQTLGKKMQSGEVNPMNVHLCGHCQAWGQLMMAGANVESVDGEAAEVTLMTASDPAVVAQIQEFTRHNIEELEKMEMAAQAK